MLGLTFPPAIQDEGLLLLPLLFDCACTVMNASSDRAVGEPPRERLSLLPPYPAIPGPCLCFGLAGLAANEEGDIVIPELPEDTPPIETPLPLPLPLP